MPTFTIDAANNTTAYSGAIPGKSRGGCERFGSERELGRKRRTMTGQRSRFPPYILRLLVIPQRHKFRVPQMIGVGPFDELKLPDQHRLQPQCRMPDYAESVLPVLFTAFSVILFRHNQTEYASTESCPVWSHQ